MVWSGPGRGRHGYEISSYSTDQMEGKIEVSVMKCKASL